MTDAADVTGAAFEILDERFRACVLPNARLEILGRKPDQQVDRAEV